MITKKEWYEIFDGATAKLTDESYEGLKKLHEDIKKDYKKRIDEINKTEGIEIATMEITPNSIQFNNGEFVMLPYSNLLKNYRDTINIKTNELQVCGVYHKKSNLILIDKRTFYFKDTPKLIYKIV